MRMILTLLALTVVAAPGHPDMVDRGDGTVADSSTGLRWCQQGNGEDIDYDDSLAYCAALELGDLTDWRLPTLEEARTLFRADREPKNTYDYRGKAYPLRIDDALTLTAPGIWTSSASYRGVPTTFLFSSGRDFSWRGGHSNFQRVLCVRAD